MSRPKKVDLDLRAYLGRGPEQRGLAEGALLIARQEYPRLDMEGALGEVDALARGAADRAAGAKSTMEKIERLNGYFFKTMGFRGNSKEYFDPRNSYLPDVMERKLGIPISLSVLYLECAWKSGLPLVGINFPGHFLVALKRSGREGGPLYIDVFQGGKVLSLVETRALLRRSAGEDAVLDPALHLREASPTEILYRVLANLKAIHLSNGQVERALWTVEWSLLIKPEGWENLKEKGVMLYSLGKLGEAEKALSLYLEKSPDPAGKSHAWQVLYAIRARNPANLN